MYFQSISTFLSLHLFLLILIQCLFAVELDGWGAIKLIPPSYFNVPTPNILRCGKLCERQGKCAAVSFNKRESRCYMHDAVDIQDITAAEANTDQAYLLKMYPDNSRNYEGGCNKATGINVPSARHENGACHNIPADTASKIATTTKITTTITGAKSTEGVTTERSTVAPTSTETTIAEAPTTEPATTQTTTTEAPTTEPTTTQTTTKEAPTTETMTTELYLTTSTVPTTTVSREDLCTPGGYTFYFAENICMKLYTKRLFQVENKQKCEDEGAHLLLIRDEAMHNFIKSTLTGLGSSDVFVDGEDPELDGNFVTWSGDSLPYINWKSGDPDTEPCMRLSASSNFDFGDELCSVTYKHGCVCEKDIP